MLKPPTVEMERLVQMTSKQNTILVHAENALRGLVGMAAVAGDEIPKMQLVTKELRETVRMTGELMSQMRMTVDVGSELASEVFTQDSGLDGLSEEQVSPF